MTEAYLIKSKANAQKAYDMLVKDIDPERVAMECKYQDVSSMMWQLREKGFVYPPEQAAEPKLEEKAIFTHEELLAASVSSDTRLRLAQRAIDNGADEAKVAKALGYKSAGFMRPRLRRMKARDETLLPDQKEAADNEDAYVTIKHAKVLEVRTTSHVKFGTLTLQAVKGNHFKFAITDPEPGEECPLPPDHVQAEIITGDFADMVDDIVAGGVIPLSIAGRTFARYAELLRWAAEEMESAARVFEPWECK